MIPARNNLHAKEIFWGGKFAPLQLDICLEKDFSVLIISRTIMHQLAPRIHLQKTDPLPTKPGMLKDSPILGIPQFLF